MSAGDDSATPVGELQTVDAQPRSGRARAASRIGRFSVLHRIGAGGMGEVLAAYDDQLDRKVAIKLVAPHLSGSSQGRVRREAQAMARVDHENVLRVYEAGEHDGQTFIAMEFVDGLDLRAWQDEAPRGWEDVLAVYVQAGRGLAAAHEAGLMHRDFKPHNAMMDAAPPLRVRVLDFGLAGQHGEAASTTPMSDDRRADSFATPITQTGDIMGTPAYMAPEQIQGTTATATADQFSFCVALWEALYGERPFGQPTTTAELFADVLDGNIRDPPADADAPGWIPPVLRRGLAVDPDDRWPDMKALLAELSRDRNARVRNVALGVVAVATLVGAALAGRELGDSGAACDDVGAELDDAWNDARRSEIRTALGSAPAEQVDGVLGTLDDYAARWREARAAACEATRAGAREEELALVRLHCLGERRVALGALAEALADPQTPTAIADALTSVADLPRIASCDDPSYLGAEVPPPEDPETRRRVEGVRETVARAEAAGGVGQFDRQRELYEAALAEAQAIGYAPLLADTHRRLAVLERGAGEPKLAMQHALAAYEHFDAVPKKTQADVLIALSRVLVDDSRLDLAGVESRRALAILESVHGPDSPETLRALRSLALVHMHDREYEAALPIVERMQATAEADPDLPTSMRAILEVDLAAILDNLGRSEDALEHYDRGLALRIEMLGEDNLEVAMTRANRALAYGHAGQPETARRELERSLEIRRRHLAPDNPLIAESLSNLGSVLSDLGRQDEARTRLEEALAIQEQAHGAEHPRVAAALNNLAVSEASRWNFARSVELLSRAERIEAQVFDPDNRTLARTRNNLAVALQKHGDFDEARAMADLAVGPIARAYGDGSVRAALARRARADIARAAGDFDEARRLYRETYELWDDTDSPQLLAGQLALVDFAAQDFERAAPAFTAAFDAFDKSGLEPIDSDLLSAAWAIAAHRLGDTETAARARAVFDGLETEGPLRELVDTVLDDATPADDLGERLRARAKWEFVAVAESLVASDHG